MSAVPVFRYKSVDRQGETEEGEIQEQSVAHVIKHMQDNGRIPIFAVEISPGRRLPGTRSWLKRRTTIGESEVLDFTRALAALLSAGTPLDRSLQIIREVEDDKATLQLIDDLYQAVRGGTALSAAVAEYGKPFSRFYISMIVAAEAGGNLSNGLERLADYLEHRKDMRDRVVSALIYPLILTIVAGLSMLLLLTYVVPQFRPMFEDMGSMLPLSTRIVLRVSDFVVQFGWISLPILLLSWLFFRGYLADPKHRFALDAAVLRLPLVGPLISYIETARMTRTFGTLLQNDVPVLRGLAIARESLSNRAMADAIALASEDLKEGGRLSGSLAATGRFPKLAIQMMIVGEETGCLDETMLRISDMYDKQVNTASQRLMTMLEPALIVVLGIGIAAIIISILAGIVSVNDLPV